MAGRALRPEPARGEIIMFRLRLAYVVPLAALGVAVSLAAAPAIAATSGIFTPTGSMHVAHTQGRATLLPGGQVLVTGANSGGGASLPSPELYNPAAGTWAVTGQMNTPRIDSTATLLPDGQVLVAGGSGGGSNALSSAELYHPATGTWSVTGSMHQGRSGLNGAGASATLLPNGEVLIAGGEDANFNLLASAELYNPATGTFTATGSMTTARVGQSATLLNNGQVLVAGGTGATAAAELYNPATGKFTATGSMSAPRGGNVGTLLPDGDVLVTGRATTFAELYHPATGQWSNASAGLPACISTMECRLFSTATLLGTGNVLVAGGLVGLVSNPQTTATAMLYHPGTNTWTSTGSMTTPRENQTATLLPGGQVLMAGGTNFDHPHAAIFLASAELYTP
jgi:Kelch motif/Galactose oxidase, central domain